jgi:MFS transporter, YNFM family, putative membrane transport protein
MSILEVQMKTATSGAERGEFRRYSVIALIAFLTLVDLFAAQAIIPTLARQFAVAASTMGVAANASTFGMAAAGLAVALFGRNIDRRQGIWMSLALLAIPTSMLAFTHDIVVFAMLRVAQGICMATAFTLTMAYLAEHNMGGRATMALSAYVTGNVASNVFGRILSVAVADKLGLEANFLVFAALNLAGAALVFVALVKGEKLMLPQGEAGLFRSNLEKVMGNGELVRAFAIGFCILFVFIGAFTYVNFRLTGEGIGLSAMALGAVYLVFLPSIATTPLAGRIVDRTGTNAGIMLTLAVAIVGLALSLPLNLVSVLAGLALVAVGTFLAQAIATGHVGRNAGSDRALASGIYLSSYYFGGAVGSFVTGIVFDGFGWEASVLLLIGVLGAAIACGAGLRRGKQP